MTFISNVRGITFIFFLFFSSFLGVFVLAGPLIPLFFLNPKLFRAVFDIFLASWLHYASALLEYAMGVKIVITGDAMPTGERSLIIMNHRTRLDWMYFWSVLSRESGVMTEKIILKNPLKKIPGAGWAMQVGAFIFIKRRWEEDKVIMGKLIQYFAAIKHKTQILLFPEGTDLSERTRKKSDEFARKNNVTPYDYLLHPRTTGFTYLVETMRKNEHLDAVYDITIAYPCNIPQQEVDLAKGNFPKEVHFHIKRHAAQSLPLNEEGLQEWCKTRWQEKEQRLKRFYEEKQFTDGEVDEKGAGDNAVSEEDRKEIASVKERESKKKEQKARRLLKFSLVYWTALVGVVFWLIFQSVLIQYYCLCQIFFFLFMSYKYGGFELFQVDYYNKFFNTKPKSLKKES